MCWQASPAAERQGRHVKEKEKAVLEFSVLSNVSVCGGCAGVAGKGALRRVWPRSRQGARKSRLANGLAPPQGHLQIHSTHPSPPPSHHKLKDKIKQWFNVLPFMFIAVTTRTPRCCQELRRRVHRAAHKPAWKTPGRQIKRSFCFFFPLFCFLMDATHPEYNGVEEEDEFEEHIGESVAVADLVVAGHGAARVCWQLAGSPRLASPRRWLLSGSPLPHWQLSPHLRAHGRQMDARRFYLKTTINSNHCHFSRPREKSFD